MQATVETKQQIPIEKVNPECYTPWIQVSKNVNAIYERIMSGQSTAAMKQHAILLLNLIFQCCTEMSVAVVFCPIGEGPTTATNATHPNTLFS